MDVALISLYRGRDECSFFMNQSWFSLQYFFLTRKIPFKIFFIRTVAVNAFVCCFPFYSEMNFYVSACCYAAVLDKVPAMRCMAEPGLQ